MKKTRTTTSTPPSAEDSSTLKGSENRDAERRTAPRAAVVYEAIRREAIDELERPANGLFWSGIAAGLSMGFSMISEGLLQARLPEAPWRILVSKLGYSVGFLIVVLGRQQLFTENTLTPVLELLRTRDGRTLLRVMRLWGVVLAANLMGAAIVAWIVATTDLFEPAAHAAFAALGTKAISAGFGNALVSGIFAGWLIALMVWLLPFAETGRVAVIVIITYVVGIGQFLHSIAGSIEVLYLVMSGGAALGDFLMKFFIPVLLGNVIGGVALVAAINYAQVAAGEGVEG